MKNIWVFNHYATKPDEPVTRAYDFGRELAKKGHKITIFASSFSHYKFKEKYLNPGENWRAEDYNGVKFIWVRTFPYKKNDWRRALNMLSYAWRVFWIGIKLKEKPDIIIGTSVHPLAVISAYLVSKIKKSRFFFEISDVWPDIFVDMGAVSPSNPFVILLGGTMRFLYKRAEKIITFFPDAAHNFKGISEEKTFWIPNGTDLSLYKNMRPYEGGNGKEFTFMYTGIHSKYAGLENILKTAKILKDEGRTDVKFVLIGDGSEKPYLKNLAEKMNLNNVEFKDIVPKTELFKSMEKADAFILSIKDVVKKQGVSSNKLNDYLAAGRPIIFSVNSENNPVKEAGAGITIPPENPEALVRAVKEMISLKPEERIQMGKNGAEYAGKYVDIKILAEKLERLI